MTLPGLFSFVLIGIWIDYAFAVGVFIGAAGVFCLGAYGLELMDRGNNGVE